MIRYAAALLLCCALAPPAASAQVVADTLVSWRSYEGPAQCRVALYASTDPDRPHVFVVRELAENTGTSTVDDARHLVDLIGRTYAIDPADAFWVFHWGGFSYEADAAPGKELFLRATFRRTSGRLGPPSWRIVTREAVEDLTDRQFR